MPGEELKISEQSIRVPLWENTQISIKPNMITTSEGLRKYPHDQRQCFFSSERQLRFYRNYTQNNCEAECLSNYTKIECGCVVFSMPSKQNAIDFKCQTSIFLTSIKKKSIFFRRLENKNLWFIKNSMLQRC